MVASSWNPAAAHGKLAAGDLFPFGLGTQSETYLPAVTVPSLAVHSGGGIIEGRDYWHAKVYTRGLNDQPT